MMSEMRTIIIFLFLGIVCEPGSSAGTTGESQPFNVPDLGRKFSLGALYDATSEKIIPGLKLWSQAELDDYIQRPIFSTKFDVDISNNIADDLSHFDLEAEVAMSFQAGLIEVSGSAAYLDNRKKTNNIARVNLRSNIKTFEREMKPRHFRNVSYPGLLTGNRMSDIKATHFVSKIQYGANSIFSFGKRIRESESKRDISGSLQIVVKSIPNFSIEGKGKFTLTENEKRVTNGLDVNFYGDVALTQFPSTYNAAVQLYKEIPSLLGPSPHFPNSQPLTVYLFPIDKLPIDRTVILLHQISNENIDSVLKIMKELEETKVRSLTILDAENIEYHPRIKRQVEMFADHIETFLTIVKQELARILPIVRGTGRGEHELAELILKVNRSPFNTRSMETWLDDIEEELKALYHTHQLPNYAKDEGDFAKLLLNDVKYTLALKMLVGIENDDFLKSMEQHIKETRKQRRRSTQRASNYTGKSLKWWRSDHSVLTELKSRLYWLAAMHRLNEQKQSGGIKVDIQFQVIESPKEDEYDDEIIQLTLYEMAEAIENDYAIPSRPRHPKTCNATNEDITIEWKEPKHGQENIKFYEVTVYKSNEHQPIQPFPFRTVGTETVITIPNLDPLTFYDFVVTTVCNIEELGFVSAETPKIGTMTASCPLGQKLLKKEKKNICVQCSAGTYADEQGLESCKECPSGTYSQIGASSCITCENGKQGKNCGDIDPCYNSPCLHSGTCLSDGIAYVCRCTPSYKGENCELVDHCASDPCRNGGACVSTTSSYMCLCKSSFKGETCEEPTGMTFGSPSGVWTLIQYHKKGHHNGFNKTWSEFEAGFGALNYLSPYYWHGLQKMHQMTSAGNWELLVRLHWSDNNFFSKNYELGHEPTPSLQGKWGWIIYSGFRIGSRSEGYTFNIRAKKTSQDWVQGGTDYLIMSGASDRNAINGMKFSSKDRDLDRFRLHCAVNAGWWYNACSHVCLNSPYPNWYPHHYPTETVMAIRQV